MAAHAPHLITDGRLLRGNGSLSDTWERAEARPPAGAMAATDEELMLQAGRGDAAAFELLFDRRRLPLLRFLGRLVRNQTLAEDLVQDTFVRLWQHRATFDGRVKLTTWLYTIAYRQALKELEKSERQTARFSELSEEDLPKAEHCSFVGGQHAPDETEGEMVLRLEVQGALQTLPLDQRTSLILSVYEKQSFHEIGEILRCSDGRARVLVHRGRQRLRKLLGPLLESGDGTCDDR